MVLQSLNSKLCIIVLLTLAVNPLFAEIYQWVDSQGVIHFSDLSHEGAIKLELSSVSYPSSSPKVEQQKELRFPPISKPTEIAIVQPEHEATIRNNLGELIVIAKINQPLQTKETLVLFCDGKIIKKTRTKSTFILKGIDRGAHELVLKILDEQGKVLSTSKAIVFSCTRHFVKKYYIKLTYRDLFAVSKI